MCVGLVYSTYEKNIAGINRYAKGLIEKMDPDIGLCCLGEEFLNIDRVSEIKCRYSYSGNMDMATKERAMLARINGLKVIYSYYYPILPNYKREIKTVLSINDLSPLYNSEWYEHVARLTSMFKEKLHRASKSAECIIAISEATKEDIVNYYDISPDKIKVATPAIAEDMYYYELSESDIIDIKDKFKIQGEYILSISTLQPRKNMESLIRAFEIYKERHRDSELKLVLTGRIGWKCDELFRMLENSKVKRDIIFTDYVSNYELAALYKDAMAFAYVSYFEGFGMPILEAMHFGKAVISSNTTSMPEVGGDAVCYCDPYSLESIVVALEQVVDNCTYRETLEKKAIIRAKTFSYEKSARVVSDVIKSLL